MTFFKQITTGINAYKEAHAFIKQHSFFSYFIIPIIFNFLLFLYFTGLIWHYSNIIADQLFFYFDIQSLLSQQFNFIQSIIKFILLVFINVIGLVIYLLVFKSLILIIMAPVLTIVSEIVDTIVTGNIYNFSLQDFVKDIYRSIRLSIKNITKEIFLSILFLIFSLLPIIGFIGPILLFTMQSYFYGFSMLDYSLERKKISVLQSEQFIWNHKFLSISIGVVFNFLLIISTSFSIFPSMFVSFILKVVLLIPLVVLSVLPIYSVVAATLVILQIEKEKSIV